MAIRNLTKVASWVAIAAMSAGCAVEAAEPVTGEKSPTESPAEAAKPAVGVVAIPAVFTPLAGGFRVATDKVTITKLSGVSGVTKSGATYDGAESLTVATGDGSIQWLKTSTGYATTLTGNVQVTASDTAPLADAVASTGDLKSASIIETIDLNTAASKDPMPAEMNGEILELTDGPTDDGKMASSASLCSAARANGANASAGAAWYSYQKSWKVLWWGRNEWNSGSRLIGPRTAECFGRCGKGCDWKWAGTKYTQACLNHDACAETYGLFNYRCNLIFAPTIWDVASNENCF